MSFAGNLLQRRRLLENKMTHENKLPNPSRTDELYRDLPNVLSATFPALKNIALVSFGVSFSTDPANDSVEWRPITTLVRIRRLYDSREPSCKTTSWLKSWRAAMLEMDGRARILVYS